MAILVVDDDAGLLRALQRVLVSHGFEVEVAAGGDQALACLRTRVFDAVVLDVTMPGVEVVPRLATEGAFEPAHPPATSARATSTAVTGARTVI